MSTPIAVLAPAASVAPVPPADKANVPSISPSCKLTPLILYLFPDDIFTFPSTSNAFCGFVIPIPTLPLLIILNTSPLPLLAVKISAAPPVCVTEIPVPVPVLFISNLSVVKTLVSRVVESPNIVKLDVVKSPIISMSPV